MNKFTWAKTKCQAIIVNVFAQEELSQRRFVSIYTDASNHGSMKIFPVLVRYFNPTGGVYVKILDVSSKGGETSTIIGDLLKKSSRSVVTMQK